jgi:RND family efflux transporter MFP subunit
MTNDTSTVTKDEGTGYRARRSRTRVSGVIALLVVGALTGAYAMVVRAEARTNKVSLASVPRPVAVIAAKAATFRKSRQYVGTLRPWVEAQVGPQLIAAYVDTVLVRPGAKVKRGEVLATLDCRNASTASSAVAMEARAVEAKQKAVADEASRQQKLLAGGYASANEVEQALAQSSAESAQLEAQKATMAHSALEVNDCILRAPFEGEVGDRFVDPGAFVRPGTAIVSLVDRSTVRFTADVPENDFEVVPPGTKVTIRVDATGEAIEGLVARRAPHADPETRTVRFEVDVPNPGKVIPVDTTGEVTIAFGETSPATEIPLYAASVRSGKVSVFVVVGNVAHSRTVAELGEIGGSLLVDRALEPGATVVTEGRALLSDGDLVAAQPDRIGTPTATNASGSKPPSGTEPEKAK